MATKTGERATLHAVANLAGVSLSTVSLVLADKASERGISESTHLKVLKAAEELNYAPNLLTRSLKRGRTHVLSFFSSYRNRERNDLYMDKLSVAIETAGGAMGYDILVHCNSKRTPKEIYQFLNGGLADGLLLFAPRHDDPLLSLLRRSNLPVVILNGEDPLRQYPSVADDTVQGMRMIADEIVAAGHERVATLISGIPDAPDSRDRAYLLRGFLRERGVHVPERQVLEAGEDNVSAVVDILRNDPEPPTCVFCWHDRLAYQFLSASEAKGVSAPDDWSVVGYDGIHWPSRTSHIVASVEVDLDLLAQAAVQLLDRTIVEPGLPATHHAQPVSFLRGSSLGAATMQRS